MLVQKDWMNVHSEDVIRRFLCCLADFTSCIIDDVFAGQSLTTVNPVLREQPAEELDACGRTAESTSLVLVN